MSCAVPVSGLRMGIGAVLEDLRGQGRRRRFGKGGVQRRTMMSRAFKAATEARISAEVEPRST